MDSEAFCNLYNIAISAACRFDDAFLADAASVFSPIMWGGERHHTNLWWRGPRTRTADQAITLEDKLYVR